MDLSSYRQSESERMRIGDLLSLVPKKGGSALDIGARDGYVSIALTGSFERVTALDLEPPPVRHGKVVPVRGDVTSLEFVDDAFDLVLCSEVLEHIPSRLLERACSEIARVTREYVIIGVPFEQDIRAGRTTCGVRRTESPLGTCEQL